MVISYQNTLALGKCVAGIGRRWYGVFVPLLGGQRIFYSIVPTPKLHPLAAILLPPRNHSATPGPAGAPGERTELSYTGFSLYRQALRLSETSGGL